MCKVYTTTTNIGIDVAVLVTRSVPRCLTRSMAELTRISMKLHENTNCTRPEVTTVQYSSQRRQHLIGNREVIRGGHVRVNLRGSGADRYVGCEDLGLNLS